MSGAPPTKVVTVEGPLATLPEGEGLREVVCGSALGSSERRIAKSSAMARACSLGQRYQSRSKAGALLGDCLSSPSRVLASHEKPPPPGTTVQL